MPDNVGYTPGTGATVAADDIGGVLFQRIKPTFGADGTATDVSASDPLPTYRRDNAAATSFSAVTAASTVLFSALELSDRQSVVLQLAGNWAGSVNLQQSNDNTNWFDVYGTSANNSFNQVSAIYAPDVVTVQVTARYFRAITSSDFAGSVSGNYAARAIETQPQQISARIVDIEPDVTFRASALTPDGYPMGMRVSRNGGLLIADGEVVSGSRFSVGPLVVIDTTGYGSVIAQVFNNSGSLNWTVTFQASNDGTTWSTAYGWPVGGAQVVSQSTTAAGQWVIPALGRFVRLQCTTYTSGQPAAVCVLKQQGNYFPASVPSTNISQIAGATVSAASAQLGTNLVQVGGTAVVTGGVAGIQAVGGNVAVGNAPTANPVPVGGWDGTVTRRLLLDANSGGVVLGSSAQNNGQTIGRVNQTATTPAATTLKSGAGRLTMLNVSQNGTVAGFLHLFNAFLALGTSTDVFCFAVPASAGTYTIDLPDGGLYFSSQIVVAFTAGSAATDNTNFGSAPSLTANYAYI